MSRKQHRHMHKIGAIDKVEEKRMLSMQELSEMTNKALWRFLTRSRSKGLNYPTYESVLQYRLNAKQA